MILLLLLQHKDMQIQYDALINNQDKEILSVFYPNHSVNNPIGIPQNEKNEFMNELKGVVVSSDAFFHSRIQLMNVLSMVFLT